MNDCKNVYKYAYIEYMCDYMLSQNDRVLPFVPIFDI
jgi:hypothetical protein